MQNNFKISSTRHENDIDPSLINFKRYQKLCNRLDAIDKENIVPITLNRQEEEQFEVDQLDKIITQRLSKRPPKILKAMIEHNETESKNNISLTSNGDDFSSIFKNITLDWNIKTRIQIHTTSSSLQWIQGSSREECQALIEIAGNTSINTTSHPRLSCMYHWIYPNPSVHPLSDLSLERLRLVKAESNTVNIHNTDHLNWKETFKSIFDTFILGMCPYFYFIRSDINILFLKSSDTAEARIRVIDDYRWIKEMERCSFWNQRVQTSEIKSQITSISSSEESILEELKEFEQVAPGSTRIHRAGSLYDQQKSSQYEAFIKADKPICFTGESVVMEIYEWIMNIIESIPLSILPILISPTIFNNASIQKANLIFPKILKRIVPIDTSIKSQEKSIKYHEELVHRVHIDGIMLPHHLSALLLQLYKILDSFEIEFTHDSHSIGFISNVNECNSHVYPGHLISRIHVYSKDEYRVTTMRCL